MDEIARQNKHAQSSILPLIQWMDHMEHERKTHCDQVLKGNQPYIDKLKSLRLSIGRIKDAILYLQDEARKEEIRAYDEGLPHEHGGLSVKSMAMNMDRTLAMLDQPTRIALDRLFECGHTRDYWDDQSQHTDDLVMQSGLCPYCATYWTHMDIHRRVLNLTGSPRLAWDWSLQHLWMIGQFNCDREAQQRREHADHLQRWMLYNS